jgi:hypothetical protein
LFRVARRDLPALAVGTVAIDADVTVQLTRYQIVRRLPVRSGVTWQTDRYRVEILEQPGQPTLVVQLTRYPRLGPADDCHLWTFSDGRWPAEHVWPHWWGHDQEYGLTRALDCSTWADGRVWTERFNVRDAAARTLILIEGRPAGVVRTRLVDRAVPVRTLD